MAYTFPACQIHPLPGSQVSFQVQGTERLRWHAATDAPRPFFYPLVGPSGSSLTRMGHPGAPDHDHHRSVWFAHNKVFGINFWADRLPPRILQKDWLAYQDGDEAAQMAVLLGWYDGHDPQELLEQEVIVSVGTPRDSEAAPLETWVEIQTRFRPRASMLEFGQTNFGFLAVRIAKSISAAFGGGQLTNSEGAVGEPDIFGKPARWMDYSGPVPGDHTEGITFFDHPSNPGHPTSWHVRSDGWMGAAPCLRNPVLTTRDQPLTLRYLLHAHSGPADQARAARTFEAFSALTAWEVVPSTVPHTRNEIRRIPS